MFDISVKGTFWFWKLLRMQVWANVSIIVRSRLILWVTRTPLPVLKQNPSSPTNLVHNQRRIVEFRMKLFLTVFVICVHLKYKKYFYVIQNMKYYTNRNIIIHIEEKNLKWWLDIFLKNVPLCWHCFEWGLFKRRLLQTSIKWGS